MHRPHRRRRATRARAGDLRWSALVGRRWRARSLVQARRPAGPPVALGRVPSPQAGRRPMRRPLSHADPACELGRAQKRVLGSRRRQQAEEGGRQVSGGGPAAAYSSPAARRCDSLPASQPALPPWSAASARRSGAAQAAKVLPRGAGRTGGDGFGVDGQGRAGGASVVQALHRPRSCGRPPQARTSTHRSSSHDGDDHDPPALLGRLNSKTPKRLPACPPVRHELARRPHRPAPAPRHVPVGRDVRRRRLRPRPDANRRLGRVPRALGALAQA